MSKARSFASGAALAVLTLGARAQHCENIYVSLSSAGTHGTLGGGGSLRPGLSADGRIVAFVSSLGGLVPNDPFPTEGEVYVRDVLAGTMELASVDSNEQPANAPGSLSYVVSVSADGRFVAFDSPATNLDEHPDTNQFPDVFVRDRWLGTTRRVSVAADGSQGNFQSHFPSISADGRYVAFASGATNLVPNDQHAGTDVFVKDLLTGAIEIVSSDSLDLQGNAESYAPDISGDGRYVAFLSMANLGAPHGNPQVLDAFVKDRVTREIQLVSLSSWGEPANRDATEVSIADDGNRVAFVSQATNLVIQGELNLFEDVFLRDRAAGTTLRVTHPAGSPLGYSNGRAGAVVISADGRWIAFTTTSTDHISPPIESTDYFDYDVFVADTLTDTFEQASRPVGGGAPDGLSTYGSMSGDARAVAFITTASNMVPGPGSSVQDMVEFRRDCLPPSSTPFCFGDGSGTACPCGNNGFPGNGCASSINSFGANLVGTGLASVTTDTFTLRGSGLTNSVVTYYQGTERTNGGAGAAFGDGLRCASGTTIRLGAINSPGGASRYPNAGDLPISIKGAIPAGGGVTRAYQVRYRNAEPTFCTPAAFNLTNGLEATWVP